MQIQDDAMILVTGASGLLGSNFILTVKKKTNSKIVAISSNCETTFDIFKNIQLDLTNEKTLKKLFEELHPQWIVHFAAMTNVDWCEEHPAETERLNVWVPGELARIAKNIDANFIYMSSDSVFDGRRGMYTESDGTEPVNEYAKSKLAGERAILKNNSSSLIVRSNIYGWNAKNNNSLAEWILNKLKEKEEVPGFTDVSFAPLLVNDLSNIIWLLMERNGQGVFHVNSADQCSKYDFARTTAKIFGHSQSLVKPSLAVNCDFKARRPENTTLQSAKLEKYLGIKVPTIKAGLMRFKALQADGFVDKLKNSIGEQ